MKLALVATLLFSNSALGAPAHNEQTALLAGSGAPPNYEPDQARLPQFDANPQDRANAVAVRKAGFTYGPSLVGEAAPFPNGTLGNARAKADYDDWSIDRKDMDGRVLADIQIIAQAIQKNGGLKSWKDYETILYDGQLQHSNPRGTAPGMISNATQDLLFSMERLSEHPHAVRRVSPLEPLPFPLDDAITSKIVGHKTSLESLRKSDSLFIVDHSYQAKYNVSTVVKRYPVACSAYFFIHPDTHDFLPLAIRTNVESDLTYTPLDTPNDWLLAKMFFNANDMFFAQMFHLVIAHDVTEAVHQAALHTLSENHPIMVMLERLMIQAYSSRPVAEELCFNHGGHWDQLMVFSQSGARQFITDHWPKDGKFQGGYLENDLKTRGLTDENGKILFKSFPFFDDAKAIRDSYKVFFTSFIDSYYKSEEEVWGDFEVSNWFIEAATKAKVLDFPRRDQICKKTLIEVLTHFAFATSVSHHSTNGAAPITSGTLPFHIPAVYQQIPKEKGVTDLMPYLPDVTTALHYLGFMASFNRPSYSDQGRTLEQIFDDKVSLDRFNAQTKNASQFFYQDMHNLSQQVRSRKFDSHGMSQGSPFIYRTLDPAYIPFFCAV
ncbi:Hypothetical protein R9X50_00000300 [Acrodontium crateriforme]|uniref:Manganese lipoxygenase n=1 Tax=Acrodontium crateriforme TaxID=150365 RepID=A0AAQ3LX77_9PEZI|nr:Hypothetical protein R9X50_00000300 [Acrodontium crateriforme]